jgi:tetratricopeptide (TPR) repeat protein
MANLQEGKHSYALRAFEKALELAPEEPQVLIALGRERLRQGRYQESEDLLRKALTKQPDSAAAAAALARVLGLHNQKCEEALNIIEQSLKICQEVASLRVIQGELLLEEGNFAEARQSFEYALADALAGEAARLGLARTFNAEGIVLCERGLYEPAIFAFKRAANLDPLWSGPHVNLGVVFGKIGKSPKAIESYAMALERDPNNPVAYYNLGVAQQELGKCAEAVCTFEELLLIAPDYPHIRGTLANALGEMKEFDRAIALFLEELDIDSECVSCWSSLGLAYICSGSVERGEQCLRRALEIDPHYFNAIINLGFLYTIQQRYDLAAETIKEAFQLDPERTLQTINSDYHFASVLNLELFDFLQQKKVDV